MFGSAWGAHLDEAYEFFDGLGLLGPKVDQHSFPELYVSTSESLCAVRKDSMLDENKHYLSTGDENKHCPLSILGNVHRRESDSVGAVSDRETHGHDLLITRAAREKSCDNKQQLRSASSAAWFCQCPDTQDFPADCDMDTATFDFAHSVCVRVGEVPQQP